MNLYEAMQACLTMRGKGVTRKLSSSSPQKAGNRFANGDYLRPLWEPGKDDVGDQKWVWNSDGVGAVVHKEPFFTMYDIHAVCGDDWVVVK